MITEIIDIEDYIITSNIKSYKDLLNKDLFNETNKYEIILINTNELNQPTNNFFTLYHLKYNEFEKQPYIRISYAPVFTNTSSFDESKPCNQSVSSVEHFISYCLDYSTFFIDKLYLLKINDTDYYMHRSENTHQIANKLNYLEKKYGNTIRLLLEPTLFSNNS